MGQGASFLSSPLITLILAFVTGSSIDRTIFTSVVAQPGKG